MHRFAPLGLLALLAFSFPILGKPDAEKPADAKEALQALQDYIGGWKGNASSEKDKSSLWKETAEWSWRFKGKEIFFSVNMGTSKLFKKGEMRYVPDKGLYQLALTTKDGKDQVFEGKIAKGGYLTLERIDPATKEGQQIKINTAGGGLRLILTYATRAPERTIFNKQFQVSYTKEGESFGTAGDKGPECVVTGGRGTSTVSYMGVTYYVCCSGCRDAFNENPAKIVAEYKARKKAGR
ncbi:MAG: hypothetical protein U0793_28730 [Gemmataceae bacterium]